MVIRTLPVEPPLDSDVASAAAPLAIRFVSLVRTLGLVEPDDESGVLLAEVREAMSALSRAGIARELSTRPINTPERLASVLQAAMDAVELSPLPDLEWAPLTELLGEELIADLTGVSASSLHRYRSGERRTPDLVAQRLHFLAMLVSDLRGSYNDYGVRRWFQRQRSALGGTTPAETLSGSWQPDDESAQRVKQLAETLLSSPGT